MVCFNINDLSLYLNHIYIEKKRATKRSKKNKNKKKYNKVHVKIGKQMKSTKSQNCIYFGCC